MALDDSRRKLLDKLNMPGDKTALGTSNAIIKLVNDWWADYKTMEETDTFMAAMTEGRLTVRQSPRVNVIPEISMKKLHVRGEESRGGKFDTGVDGVKLRMNPANFEQLPEVKKSGLAVAQRWETKQTERRGKYVYGLHDLSASLLDPLRPTLTEQLNSTDGKLLNYDEVFMPVASEEDHQVYCLLSKHAKSNREHVAKSASVDEHGELYSLMVKIRRSMTRIKLAEDKDMHCGFIDIRKIGSEVSKYRYGLGAMTDKGVKTPKVTEAREKAALHYKSITALARTTGSGYNEIIIAYREHKSPLFPIIARWNGTAFDILTRGGVPVTVAKTIPDLWANFVE